MLLNFERKSCTVYEATLRKAGSPITVKSILLEEKEHLNEMTEGLKAFFEGFMHAEKVCAFEEELSKKWIHSINKSINNF